MAALVGALETASGLCDQVTARALISVAWLAIMMR